MNPVCIYLASPRLYTLSIDDLRLNMLCKSIENTSKQMKPLPYIIFHEDLIEEDFEKIRRIYSNISFEKLDFVRDDLSFIKFGRPKGYMLMCRFFSGELQNHEALQNYDSYIRFDDDSFLLEPFLKKEDLVEAFKYNDYIFRTLFIDGQSKFNNDLPMQSLYKFTIYFINRQGYSINNLIPILKIYKFLDINGQYTGIAPYNNFHACKLSLWKEPLIKKYVDELLERNGCLMEFWMDANIHAMIIYILMPLINKKVGVKTDFGYRHNKNFSIMKSLKIQYKNTEDFYPK